LASSEAWAEHIAQQALARGLVLRAGDACRVKIETELLHDQRAHRGGTRAVGARELHGGTAAHLGAGRREPRNRRSSKLGQHRVALGQLVVDLEGFGQQANHAPSSQVAQDAYARYLQDVDYCGTLEEFRTSREGLWRAKLAFAPAITSSVLSLAKARKLGIPLGRGT